MSSRRTQILDAQSLPKVKMPIGDRYASLPEWKPRTPRLKGYPLLDLRQQLARASQPPQPAGHLVPIGGRLAQCGQRLTRTADFQLEIVCGLSKTRNLRVVGFDSNTAHHSFISTLRRRQVIEEWCRCGGSIEPISVERDSVGEEQQLKPLLVVERRLHPQVGGARQNAFCERQDALYVEFVDGLGVMVDLGC